MALAPISRTLILREGGGSVAPTTAVTIPVPVIELQPLRLSVAVGKVGVALSVDILDALAGSTIAGAAPGGLTLDGDARRIAGTPTTEGEFEFELVETYLGVERRTLVTLTIAAADVVDPGLKPLRLSSASGKVGLALDIDLLDATPQSLIAATVPAGLTLDSATRKIAGTPTTNGVFEIEFVETLSGFERRTILTLTIAEADVVIELNPLRISPAAGKLGVELSIDVLDATDGSDISGSIPAGLTLASAARKITGTPDTSGTFEFEMLESYLGFERRTLVTLTIAPADAVPVITTQERPVTSASAVDLNLVLSSVPDDATITLHVPDVAGTYDLEYLS